LNLVNGTRAKYDDVDVGWPCFNSEDVLKQEIAQQASHHNYAPLRWKEPDDSAEITSWLTTLKTT
jgi:hypothetical protein